MICIKCPQLQAMDDNLSRKTCPKKIFYEKHVLRKSFTPSQKMILFNSHLHIFQVNYALDGLVYLLFILFFYIGPLKLRIQGLV